MPRCGLTDVIEHDQLWIGLHGEILDATILTPTTFSSVLSWLVMCVSLDLSVCVCVCVFLCVCFYVYICVCVCVHVCVGGWCVCMCVSCACVSVCMCVGGTCDHWGVPCSWPTSPPSSQDVVDTHPGLSFLSSAPEFHARYVETVSVPTWCALYWWLVGWVSEWVSGWVGGFVSG